MTMLNVNDDQLRQVVAGAILQTLTAENREKLIADAVASLIVVEPKDNYGRVKTSKLEEAFAQSAYQVALEICRDEMKKPENVDRLKKIVATGFEHALTENSETIGAAIGGALSEVLADRARIREARDY